MGECKHKGHCYEYEPGDAVCDNWGGRTGPLSLKRCMWYNILDKQQKKNLGKNREQLHNFLD
ncbi:hypothetical protein FJZ19_05695 [Candidatus Pacearchaeota archaeon]|nr:hypothetical protein [Candidatus Pacearchaeota archaeon]